MLYMYMYHITKPTSVLIIERHFCPFLGMFSISYYFSAVCIYAHVHVHVWLCSYMHVHVLCVCGSCVHSLLNPFMGFLLIHKILYMYMQKFLSAKYFCGYSWPKHTKMSTKQIIETMKIVHISINFYLHIHISKTHEDGSAALFEQSSRSKHVPLSLVHVSVQW